MSLSFLAALILTSIAIALTACTSFRPLALDASQGAMALEGRTLQDAALRDYLRTSGASVSRWPLQRWVLVQLSGAAHYYQPDLAVLRAKADTAEAAVRSAGEMPNPTLSFKPGYNSSSSGVTPWIIEPALDFTIETAGKRGHRRMEALAKLRAARLDVATAEWKARSDVRKALLALQGAEEARAQLASQQKAQGDAVRLLESQVRDGGASLQDVTVVRIPLQQTRLALHDAEIGSLKSRAQLAAAIGVPISALAAIDFDFTELSRLPSAPPGKRARRHALTHRTDILSALAAYAAADERLRLEVAKQYPDIHLGPSYKMDQNENKWTLGLALELPIFNQRRGPIAEAESRRNEAAQSFLAVQAKALAEIDMALSIYRATLGKSRTAQSLVADVNQRTAATAKRLAAGDASQLEVTQVRVEEGAAALSRTLARQQSLEALGALEDALQTPSSQWK